MGRLAVVAQALRHARALAERERWPIERREARKRERLTDLVRHAAGHSAYYREALAGYDPAVGAGSLPELSKATMMERASTRSCATSACAATRCCATSSSCGTTTSIWAPTGP